MKIAKSMNHGNTETPAELIGYDDCRDDRVTCLACGDRVFKVVRRGNPEQHFLSHYSFAANPRECEERVRIMQIASLSKASRPISDERRHQGLDMRVRALGRVLMDQFPETARASNGFARRLEAATIRDAAGTQVPDTAMRLPVFATIFQLLSRQEGHEVAHSDLVFTHLQNNWRGIAARVSRWSPTTMRRTSTAPGTEQDRWAMGMTSLLCLASSHTPLMMLVRHAWADLVINGIRDRAQGADQRRAALAFGRKIFEDPMRKDVDDGFETRVPDPLAMNTTIGDLLGGMIATRMRDILAGIDYGAPVPSKGPSCREPMKISMPISGSVEVQKLFSIRDSLANGPSLPIGRIDFAKTRISMPSVTRK